jgi:hypothetical protein
MYCNIENYVLQHLKQYYCSITKTSVATTQKSHCNIQKSFVAIFKKNPLQHGRNNKKRRTKTAPAPSPLSSPKEGGNRTPEFAETLATAASLRSEEEEEDE